MDHPHNLVLSRVTEHALDEFASLLLVQQSKKTSRRLGQGKGGLSGNQGAFRSAFLLGAGLGKDAFIATGVVLACVVDVTRLGVYAGLSGSHMITDNAGLVVAATLSAFLGVHFSRKMLKKITIRTVRVLVGVMLLALGDGLAMGLI